MDEVLDGANLVRLEEQFILLVWTDNGLGLGGRHVKANAGSFREGEVVYASMSRENKLRGVYVCVEVGRERASVELIPTKLKDPAEEGDTVESAICQILIEAGLRKMVV